MHTVLSHDIPPLLHVLLAQRGARSRPRPRRPESKNCSPDGGSKTRWMDSERSDPCESPRESTWHRAMGSSALKFAAGRDGRQARIAHAYRAGTASRKPRRTAPERSVPSRAEFRLRRILPDCKGRGRTVSCVRRQKTAAIEDRRDQYRSNASRPTPKTSERVHHPEAHNRSTLLAPSVAGVDKAVRRAHTEVWEHSSGPPIGGRGDVAGPPLGGLGVSVPVAAHRVRGCLP